MRIHGHPHSYDAREQDIRPIIKLSLALNFLFFLAGLTTALIFGSIALLGDSFHNLSHVLVLIFSLAGLTVIKQHKNLIPIGNSIFLMGVAGWLIYEGISRLFMPPQEILGLPLVIVASLDTGSDAFIALLMRKHRKNLAALSLLFHFLFDGLISLSVILGGIFIMLWGWYYVDAYAAILIGATAIISSLFVIWKAFGQLRKDNRQI